jgi:Flp pilus assembly protein TadB
MADSKREIMTRVVESGMAEAVVRCLLGLTAPSIILNYVIERRERIEELRERESEMREMEENKREMVEKVTSWREETERHLRQRELERDRKREEVTEGIVNGYRTGKMARARAVFMFVFLSSLVFCTGAIGGFIIVGQMLKDYGSCIFIFLV